MPSKGGQGVAAGRWHQRRPAIPPRRQGRPARRLAPYRSERVQGRQSLCRADRAQGNRFWRPFLRAGFPTAPPAAAPRISRCGTCRGDADLFRDHAGAGLHRRIIPISLACVKKTESPTKATPSSCGISDSLFPKEPVPASPRAPQPARSGPPLPPIMAFRAHEVTNA
jgi:hypothetical protein